MSLDHASRSLLPGIVYSEQAGCPDPTITVIGGEKTGKSSLTVTLYDWPNDGDRPLVLAIDRTGIDACASLGYAVPHWKIADLPGDNLWERLKWAVEKLEEVYIRGGKKPYSTIVVDCASTLTNQLWYMYAGMEQRNRFGRVLDHSGELMNRLGALGVPVIWYGWALEEQTREEGSKNKGTYSKKTIPGGLMAVGSFKTLLPGVALHNFILERRKAPANAQGVSSDGFQRVLHTKPWNGINGGGRYALPEPMEADLGLALSFLTGMIQSPAQIERGALKR